MCPAVLCSYAVAATASCESTSLSFRTYSGLPARIDMGGDHPLLREGDDGDRRDDDVHRVVLDRSVGGVDADQRRSWLRWRARGDNKALCAGLWCELGSAVEIETQSVA